MWELYSCMSNISLYVYTLPLRVYACLVDILIVWCCRITRDLLHIVSSQQELGWSCMTDRKERLMNMNRSILSSINIPITTSPATPRTTFLRQHHLPPPTYKRLSTAIYIIHHPRTTHRHQILLRAIRHLARRRPALPKPQHRHTRLPLFTI